MSRRRKLEQRVGIIEGHLDLYLKREPEKLNRDNRLTTLTHRLVEFEEDAEEIMFLRHRVARLERSRISSKLRHGLGLMLRAFVGLVEPKCLIEDTDKMHGVDAEFEAGPRQGAG
jgi:hypothetical protein